jgi:hypothetical protein
MKKLVVLLLAFAVAGAAFAQTPALTGSATLSWGIDLDTGYTGFRNVYSAKVTIPFAVADGKKAGETGWWGEIAVTGITFKLTDDPVVGNDAAPGFTNGVDSDDSGVIDADEGAAISAKITDGTWALSVYSAASPDFAVADVLSSDADVALATDADKFGTKLSYAANGLSFAIIASSKGDWGDSDSTVTNTLNEYAMGLRAGYDISENLGVDFGFGYDILDADKEVGVFASTDAKFGALTVFAGSDMTFLGGFDADAIVDASYAVMEGLDASAVVYFSTTDNDIETELAVDYAVGAIEAGVWFNDYNALNAAAYELGVYGGYTLSLAETTELYVYAEYVNDLTGATGTLTPSVVLTDTTLANTTLKLQYNYDEVDVLAGNIGSLIASAKVSL